MSYAESINCWISGAAAGPFGGIPGEPGDFAEVAYDLARLRAEVDRDAIAAGPASMWRYKDLLPVERPEEAVTLGEGWTPMIPAQRLADDLRLRTLFMKDEGQNPSGTFKDRGASASVTRLRELGATTVVHNSSGNAGGSWAMYAARAGIRCVNLLPDDVLPAALQQSLLSGAATYILDGHWKEAGAMVADAVDRNGWTDIRTLREPYRLEGKKTMGFEIAEQLGWELPDAVIYPTGGGIGAIAIFKAFEELQALGWVAPGPLPRLIVTQFAGCAPIVKAFNAGVDRAETWQDLDVPPGGLKSTTPPGDRRVLALLAKTGGAAVAVDTDDAIATVAEIAAAEGVFACPESATAYAGLRTLCRRGEIDPASRIVIVSTGSGLKSTPVLPIQNVAHLKPGDAIPGDADTAASGQTEH